MTLSYFAEHSAHNFRSEELARKEPDAQAFQTGWRLGVKQLHPLSPRFDIEHPDIRGRTGMGLYGGSECPRGSSRYRAPRLHG